jgi:hypothetical protein
MRSGRQEEDERDHLSHHRNETNEDPPTAQVRIVETTDPDCRERHDRRTDVERQKIRTNALTVRFEQRTRTNNQRCEKSDPPKVFATRAALKNRIVFKVAADCVDHGEALPKGTLGTRGLALVGEVRRTRYGPRRKKFPCEQRNMGVALGSPSGG